MRLTHLIISIALAVSSLASMAQSQEVLYLDRSSFGKAVLSQTESTVGDIQLELSIGDYKNEPIINYSNRSDLVQFGRSVGRLDVLYDKGISSCTAFIVSKQYILTNYHCSLGILENARIDATRIDAITFVAGYTQTGIEEGTRKYTVIPTPIEASKELDYAVLEVVGDPSQEYGELKLASLAPQSGDPFWIIGHPMGEGQRVSREKCRASSPAVSAGKLLHTCDTLPGNSGSPVIDVSLRQVVAPHHAGSHKDSVNYAILMSEILENRLYWLHIGRQTKHPSLNPKQPRLVPVTPCTAPLRRLGRVMPTMSTKNGDYATGLAKQFQGLQATCELTGAKTYDRLVGYCSINGDDFGRYMMENSTCKVWVKYDVWDRY